MDSENIGLYKYGSKKIKELNLDLWEKINNVLFDISFKEKFYIIENSLIGIPKCECGNSVKFIDMIKGYREFCSRRCMYDSEKIKKKRKDTCVDKYGVDNPSKVKEVRDKVISTNLDKFGHEWATKSEDIKIIIKDKFIEKYGVDNPSKVKEVRDKAKMTMLDRYGVEYAMHSDEIKNKVIDKFVDRYNVDNPSKVKEIRDKAKMTMLDRYGVEYAMQNKSIKDKCKKNSIEKYGVDNPFASDIIKEKIKKTNIEKYGSINPFASDIIKEKIKKTNIEKYGYDHISKNSDYREKYNITTNSNYLNYIKDGVSLFSCDRGEDHNFEIYIDNYIKRINSGIPICTICNPIGDLKSIKEKELYLYINNIYDGEIIQSYRDVLEIDIYLPELKIGFEFNGLYWHSDLKKDRNYHINKTNYFRDKGIRIIHIWEDDWTFNRDIIKSQISNWIGNTPNKIFARKCDIRIVDIKSVRSFLDDNHIQGYVNNKLAIGLYNDDNLVSLMTFDNYEGRKKMVDGGWNLSRFCNKLNTNVIGGSSKLLKFFVKNYNPNRIISYADKDWSQGDLYYTLGFDKVSDSNPDYKYIIDDRRVHKSRYKRSNLKLSNISESEYTKMNNINRIWDCGKLKFEKLIK